MSNRKSGELSRRRFLSASIGAAVSASVGCASDRGSNAGTAAGGRAEGSATGGGPPLGGVTGGSGGPSPGSPGAPASGGVGARAGGGNGGFGADIPSGTSGGATAGTGTSPASGEGAAAGDGTLGGSGGSTAGSGSSASRAGGSTSGGVGSDGAGTGSGESAPSGSSGSGGSSTSVGGTAGGQTGTGGGPSPGSSVDAGSAGAPMSAGGQGQGGGSITGGTSAAGDGGAVNPGGRGGTGGQNPPLVCLVRNTDVGQAVKDAIAAVGGLPDLTGKTVLLRPNAIIADGPPYTTGAEVVRAVIQVIKANSAPASILVGEDAFIGNTVDYMRNNGIYEAATSEGATPVDLGEGTTRTVRPEGATNWPDGIICFEAFLDADYVINMPVCKSHSYANYTMAIKAWYGCQTNYRNAHPNNLQPALAELHLARKADFVVLDATKTLLTNGPLKGSNDLIASPGIIVASPDTVAADVTGLCIMKHYLKQENKTGGAINNLSVWEQAQIVRAQELTSLGWITGRTFPYEARGIDEEATIMAYRDA